MADVRSEGPASSKLSDSYDAWHHRFDAVSETDSPWHTLVKRHIGSIRSLSVLEIGCGRGGFAQWLVEREPGRLVAADFSWTAVARAATHLPETCPMQADIGRLPFGENTFDLVISCETVEHVPDPRAAVGELSRVLKDGGRLLLTTPNYLNMMGAFRGYRRLVGRPFTEEGQPINNFTTLPRTMWWMRKAGLHPRLVDSSGYYLILPKRLPINVGALERHQGLVRWLASHQLLVASKRG